MINEDLYFFKAQEHTNYKRKKELTFNDGTMTKSQGNITRKYHKEIS